jgi:hypothetical protein
MSRLDSSPLSTSPPPADLYDAWMFAAADATLSLEAWRSAAGEEKRGAYASYVAALDREARAAGVLEHRVRAPR